jgi:hypothetical protein
LSSSKIGALFMAAALAVVLIVATIQKITALALLGYAGVVYFQCYKPKRKHIIAAVAVITVIVCALIYSFRSLYMHYIDAVICSAVVSGRPVIAVLFDMVLNLVGCAIPAQIWPNFSYVFSHSGDPAGLALLVVNFKLQWIPGLAVGLFTTAVVVRGAMLARKSLAPELVWLLLVIPAYSPVLDGAGTVRYLAYSQPVFLLLFLIGMAPILDKVRSFIETHNLSLLLEKKVYLGLLLIAGGLMAIISTVTLRSSVTARSTTSHFGMIEFLTLLDRDTDMARSTMKSLAKPDVELITTKEGAGLWYLLYGIPYVREDLAVKEVCRGKKVYAVTFCDRRNCPLYFQSMENSLEVARQTASIRLEPVSQYVSAASELVIYRIQPVSHCIVDKPWP